MITDGDTGYIGHVLHTFQSMLASNCCYFTSQSGLLGFPLLKLNLKKKDNTYHLYEYFWPFLREWRTGRDWCHSHQLFTNWKIWSVSQINLVMSVYHREKLGITNHSLWCLSICNTVCESGKIYLEYGHNYLYHGHVRTSSATPSWPSPISRKAFWYSVSSVVSSVNFCCRYFSSSTRPIFSN